MSVGISVFILNKRLNMLTNPSAEMVQFQEESICLIEGLGYMAQSIPVYKYIPTPSSRRFMKAVHFLDNISVKFINERKAVMNDLGTEDSTGFLDQWLVDGKLSTKEIVPLVRDFLVAGVDTVSSLALCRFSECVDSLELNSSSESSPRRSRVSKDVPQCERDSSFFTVWCVGQQLQTE